MKSVIRCFIIIFQVITCLSSVAQDSEKTGKWENSPVPYWYGNDKQKFRLTNNCILEYSGGSSGWITSSDGIWVDGDGKLLRVQNGDLQRSEDGINWKQHPEKTWKDANGNLFKLGRNCSLLIDITQPGTQAASPVSPEKEEYKKKIDNKLQYIDKKLAEIRVTMKSAQYKQTKLKLEKNKMYLQKKLHELGNNLEQDWAKFRAELDIYFQQND